MEFVAGILYIPATGLIVISVLLVHNRTPLAQKERLIHCAICFLTAGWMIIFLVLWIVQVLPVQDFWLFELGSRNIVNQNRMNIARNIIEALLLSSTLVLSYRAIPSKLSRRPKWLLA